MNCRFTAIGARHFNLSRALVILDSFTSVALCNGMSMALHHCPGEGSGES